MKEDASDKRLPIFCLSNCLSGLLQLMASVPCVTGSSPSFQTQMRTMSHLHRGLSQNLRPHLFSWASRTVCSFCSWFGATCVLASSHLSKQRRAQLGQLSGTFSAGNNLFLFLPRHGIFMKVFTMDYHCSLRPISALPNLVKISLKVQKLSKKGGGEQMDERGVDRQHDLIDHARWHRNSG